MPTFPFPKTLRSSLLAQVIALSDVVHRQSSVFLAYEQPPEIMLPWEMETVCIMQGLKPRRLLMASGGLTLASA